MKVFYVPAQTAEANESFSPSASKPARVVESWQRLRIPLELVAFEPASRDTLALAHDRAYVDAVLDLQRPNGFSNVLPEVAATLPYTSGSMVAAARHAVRTGEGCASPTSGFHHAGWDHGGGYCTFNGLMVAALALRHEGLTRRVGVLDLDCHFGNGTDGIIRKLGLNWVDHYSYGAERMRNAEAWLAQLPEIVRRFAGCDVLLYQAGADPHVDDPLGGDLTTAQMRRRDEIVFATLRELGIPVAWNLAGGYQTPLRKVLDLHDNTAIAFHSAMREIVSA